MIYGDITHINSHNHWNDLYWSCNCIIRPPDVKNRLIWEDSVAGKDWRQEEKETREGEWLDGITNFSWVQFVKLLSHVHLFVTPWIAARQVSTAHHQLPESTQTHVHRVSDAIQPSHPLSSPFPPAFNLSQHQDLFQWVSSSHQVAKVLELQLQHLSFKWIFRTELL